MSSWTKQVKRYQQTRQDMRKLGADPDEIIDIALMLAQLGITRDDIPGLARTWLFSRGD